MDKVNEERVKKVVKYFDITNNGKIDENGMTLFEYKSKETRRIYKFEVTSNIALEYREKYEMTNDVSLLLDRLILIIKEENL